MFYFKAWCDKLDFDARFGSTIGPMFAITRGQIFWRLSIISLGSPCLGLGWEEADGKEAQTGSRALRDSARTARRNQGTAAGTETGWGTWFSWRTARGLAGRHGRRLG